MYVCHCKAVSDTEIRDAVSEGAVDEIDIAMSCGAGTGCGSCINEVQRLCEAAQRVDTPVLISVGD